uniref:Uncharacterized protein n=1 Tax=Megaselia scalaris TaxID=36166 RepID=T1GZH1_MEGSC
MFKLFVLSCLIAIAAAAPAPGVVVAAPIVHHAPILHPAPILHHAPIIHHAPVAVSH